MLLLDLETGLAKHGGTFDMSLYNRQVEWVLSLVGLNVELEIHCLLDQRQQDGCQYVNISSLRSKVDRSYISFPDLLRVRPQVKQCFYDLASCLVLGAVYQGRRLRQAFLFYLLAKTDGNY